MTLASYAENATRRIPGLHDMHRPSYWSHDVIGV